MNKTLKLMLAALITISAGSVMAQAKNVDNWVNSTGTPWRNGDGTLCWRDATWTPATAAANCDVGDGNCSRLRLPVAAAFFQVLPQPVRAYAQRRAPVQPVRRPVATLRPANAPQRDAMPKTRGARAYRSCRTTTTPGR